MSANPSIEIKVGRSHDPNDQMPIMLSIDGEKFAMTQSYAMAIADGIAQAVSDTIYARRTMKRHATN